MLLNPGVIPSEEDAARRAAFTHALSELGRRADHRGVRLAIETAPDPGPAAKTLLDAIASPGLAVSLDPSPLLNAGHDPAATVQTLSDWLVHGYAPDPDRTAATGMAFGRRGISAGRTFHWEEYLGALEEVGYRGFLTVWPEAKTDPATAFAAVKAQTDRF